MRRALLFACLAACASDREGSISITTGEEVDAFSRAPAPTTLVVETISLEGTRTEIARADLPVDTVPLGELTVTDVGALAVRALGADGKTLLAGETLFVQWGALELGTLEVFVQRTGELARFPRGPSAIEPSAVVNVAGRYLLFAQDTTAYVYDLLGLRTLSSPTILPRPVRSMTPYGTTLIVIDDQGASAVDLQLGTSRTIEPPSGGVYGDVSGGATVLALDGGTFVVGGTRAGGGPTTRILSVSSDGNVTFANLAAPREGACATWVQGRGLVVYGGSDTASGAEVLAPGATVGAPLPVPPDPVRGCGVAPLDPSHVLVVGGGGPARVLDLACAASCAPVPWASPVPLVRADVHPLGPDAAFVAGDAADGATRAYRISPTEIREVPLRVPRRGARLVSLPTEAAALVGGGVGIESYRE